MGHLPAYDLLVTHICRHLFEWHVAHFQVGQILAIKHNNQGNLPYVYSLHNASGNSSPEISFIVMLLPVPICFLILEYVS